MEQPRIDVRYIARLVKLDLTAEETASFTQDLDQILAYVAQLEQWDTAAVAPMYNPLPTPDALRADVPGMSLSNDEAISNAPAAAEGQFRVPKVVESAH